MSQYDYSIHLGLGHSGENKLKLDGQWFIYCITIEYPGNTVKDIVDI